MNYKIQIKRKKQSIVVKRTNKTIKIYSQVKRGAPGPQGPQGEGLPEGGLEGQVLTKFSDSDYDYNWSSSAGNDKYYSQDFLPSTIVNVVHNLNKYPAVTIHDSAGDEVEGYIEHLNMNELRLVFSAPFSGNVYCN